MVKPAGVRIRVQQTAFDAADRECAIANGPLGQAVPHHLAYLRKRLGLGSAFTPRGNVNVGTGRVGVDWNDPGGRYSDAPDRSYPAPWLGPPGCRELRPDMHARQPIQK